MIVLALETSGHGGEVALLAGDRLLARQTLAAEQRTARSLTPAIAQVLADVQLSPSAVQLVAVTIGPGSFTGLRIGATTAKTFAYAVGAHCLAVDTLEVLAAQVPLGLATSAWAVLDAQRQQLFATPFAIQGEYWQASAAAQVIDNDAFLAQLVPGMVVTGPGLKRLLGRVPAGVIVAEERLWQPQAETVGRLAWREFQKGRRDDLWQLAPRYLRPSAAEEKRSAVEKNV